MTELTGKDLGIAIAEEVMGWNQYSSDKRWIYPLFSTQLDCLVVTDSEESTMARCWSPWRDMNDAWEVVLRLRDEHSLTFECGVGPTICWAKFWTRMLKAFSEEVAATMPEAILQAALAAVRGGR